MTHNLPNPAPEDTHAVFTAGGTLISVVSRVTPATQDGHPRPAAPAELWEYEEHQDAFDLVRGLWPTMLQDPRRTVWLPVPPDRFDALVGLLHETDGLSPATGLRWNVQELGPLIGHDPDSTEQLWRRMRRRVPGPDGLRPPREVQVLPPGIVPHAVPADQMARFAAFAEDGVLEGLLVGIATEGEEGIAQHLLWELDARLRAFYTPGVDRTEELFAGAALVVPCSEAEFEDLYSKVCRDRGVNTRTGQRWHRDDLAGRLSGYEEACALAEAERADTATSAVLEAEQEDAESSSHHPPHPRPSQED